MATKAWSMNSVGESVNDGPQSIPAGRHVYQIASMKMVPVKDDPTGNESQIEVVLKNDAGNYRTWLSVMDKNPARSGIAEKIMRGFAHACGIGGIINAKRFPSFADKTVIVEAKEAHGKGEAKDKTYTNIVKVEAYDPDADGSGETETEVEVEVEVEEVETDVEVEVEVEEETETEVEEEEDDDDATAALEAQLAAAKAAKAAKAAAAAGKPAGKPAAAAAGKPARPWG